MKKRIIIFVVVLSTLLLASCVSQADVNNLVDARLDELFPEISVEEFSQRTSEIERELDDTEKMINEFNEDLSVSISELNKTKIDSEKYMKDLQEQLEKNVNDQIEYIFLMKEDLDQSFTEYKNSVDSISDDAIEKIDSRYTDINSTLTIIQQKYEALITFLTDFM